jgi:hypothetical protein
MAKATTKTTKPKAPKTVAALPKAKATAKPETKTKAAAKPKAPAKPKTKAAKPKAGIIKQTTDAISQLASDILADRIVPTIEQIKAIAASALAQDQTKGKRPKKKK